MKKKFSDFIIENDDDNPHRSKGYLSKVGILRFHNPEDEKAYGDWNKQKRDKRDADYLKKNGPIPQLGDFVKRKSYYKRYR